MLIMETYRQAKDLPKALQTGKEALAKYPSDPAVRATYALLLGENQQADEGVETAAGEFEGHGRRIAKPYLNLAQIYERSHRYQGSGRDGAQGRGVPG